MEGAETVFPEEALKIAESSIAGKYFFLFPKNNALIYPRWAVKREILNGIKKVKAVETETNGNTLSVKITERKPTYVWCPQGLPDEKAVLLPKFQCYFLDQDGFSFSEAPRFSGPVFFEIYATGTLANEDDFVGVYPFKKSKFDNLMAFKNGLEAINLSPVRLIELKDRDYKFILKNRGAIFINDKNDLAVSLRNLASAKKSLEDGGKAANSLEYIDLRFGNKVFFKPE